MVKNLLKTRKEKKIFYGTHFELMLGLYNGGVTDPEDYPHIDRTLEYFIGTEDYEKCAILKKIKNSLVFL